MNALLHRCLAALLAAFLLAGNAAAQRPQGAGENLVAVANAAGVPVAITNAGVLVRSLDGGETYADVLYTPLSGDYLTTLSTRGSKIVAGGNGFLVTLDLSILPLTPVLPTVPSLFGDFSAIANDGNTGWVAVTDTAEVLRSTDGGSTWTEWNTGISAFELSGVNWNASNSKWMAVGDDTVYTRAPADESWSSLQIASTTLLDIAADGFGNVLLVGQGGAVYRSTNNGLSFTQLMADAYSEDFLSITVLGQDDFVIGGQQRLLVQIDAGSDTELLSLVYGAPDVTSLVSSDGAVVMSGVAIVPAPSISAIDNPAAPVLVTLTPDDPGDSLFYSTDGGDPTTPYADPFPVTSTVIVQAVSLRDGVYSPVVSDEVVAGSPNTFTLSIARSGANLLITQDGSDIGLTYQLQYSDNLAATPQVWTNEQVTKPGTGSPLVWTISPIPTGPRAWRVVLP